MKKYLTKVILAMTAIAIIVSRTVWHFVASPEADRKYIKKLKTKTKDKQKEDKIVEENIFIRCNDIFMFNGLKRIESKYKSVEFLGKTLYKTPEFPCWLPILFPPSPANYPKLWTDKSMIKQWGERMKEYYNDPVLILEAKSVNYKPPKDQTMDYWDFVKLISIVDKFKKLKSNK